MNRLLYLDLFLGTSYSGASYLEHTVAITLLSRDRFAGGELSTSARNPLALQLCDEQFPTRRIKPFEENRPLLIVATK
jgi:hypothetical protein